DAFVDAFSTWASEQMVRARTFEGGKDVAVQIAERSQVAVDRMKEGMNLLRAPEGQTLRTAFALAMAAMRLQMRQTSINRGTAEGQVSEPQWYPFQLGFLLVSL